MELNKNQSKQFITVPEAARFLNISRNSVLAAIKTKKLHAKKEGYYWKIPMKTVESYNTLRKNAREKKKNPRGIDSKSVALYLLTREISQVDVQNITITKNLEMLRGNTSKPLIDQRGVPAASLHLLMNALYQTFEGRFFNDNLELSFEQFLQRLFRLQNLLERVNIDPKRLSTVKGMIKTVHSLSTQWVKLEACTGKLLTDQGPVFFGARNAQKTQEVIRNFCAQAELTHEEITHALETLSQPYGVHNERSSESRI